MKVDMSPEAITGRLRTMDELWTLSAKLMNSKPTDGLSLSSRRSRALEIVDAIREVLYEDWDPLALHGHSPNDEYDAYLAPVYRVLVDSRLENELVEVLRRIEREEMGIDANSIERLRPVAKKLLELNVALD